MLLKAAINGGRSKTEHPSIPVTDDEITSAVVECLNAGANAIHFHVRGKTGYESLAAEDVVRTLRHVRMIVPEAPLGLSTGGWIIPEMSVRLKTISEWTAMPDFASVNFNEDGAVDLARELLLKGVQIEAGLSDSGAAEEFVKSGLAPRCLRVLLEPQEEQIAEARANVRAIKAWLNKAGINVPCLLHGTGATTWQIMHDAIIDGYDLRIGFEDTLLLPDGTVAASNAELLAEARRRMACGVA